MRSGWAGRSPARPRTLHATTLLAQGERHHTHLLRRARRASQLERPSRGCASGRDQVFYHLRWDPARVRCRGWHRSRHLLGGERRWVHAAAAPCCCLRSHADAPLPPCPCTACPLQDNLKGELGRGVPGDAVISPAAISVPAGLQFDQVLASNHFSYARALDGQWWCCGCECCVGLLAVCRPQSLSAWTRMRWLAAACPTPLLFSRHPRDPPLPANEYGQCAQNSTSAELPTPVPVPESAGYQELQLVRGLHGPREWTHFF